MECKVPWELKAKWWKAYYFEYKTEERSWTISVCGPKLFNENGRLASWRNFDNKFSRHV